MQYLPLTPAQRDIILHRVADAGLQNCNYSYTNLMAWRSVFNTEYTLIDNQHLVLRLHLYGQAHHLLVIPPSASALTTVVEALLQDSPTLCITAVDEPLMRLILQQYPHCRVEEVRNQADYLYSHEELSSLVGRHLQKKRNHANRFRKLYPNYEYRTLTPALIPQCLSFTQAWQQHALANGYDTHSIAWEDQAIRYVFSHWEELAVVGGCLFVDERLVAYTYGGAITPTLFDVCVEKADSRYEGAYTVINQEFNRHLPHQYTLINREEDMGLEGLRQAKLSYHPTLLLPYYRITITP